MNQNININQLPKQFSENIIVGSGPQSFYLVVMVGTNANAYAITPEHAKGLHKVLSEHIEKFEKNVRPLPDVHAPVPSPIQISHNGEDDQKNTT